MEFWTMNRPTTFKSVSPWEANPDHPRKICRSFHGFFTVISRGFSRWFHGLSHSRFLWILYKFPDETHRDILRNPDMLIILDLYMGAAIHGRALAPRHFSGASSKSKWLLIKSIWSLHLNLWHGGGPCWQSIYTWRTKTLRILRVNARTWGISEKIRKPRFSIEDLGYWFWTRT
jgi:hypothetical protein